jgi:hypothetical protein
MTSIAPQRPRIPIEQPKHTLDNLLDAPIENLILPRSRIKDPIEREA